MPNLLAVGGAGRCTLDGKVVGYHADIAAVDLGEPDDLAIAGGLRLVFFVHAGGAEQSGFYERARIDKSIEAFHGVEFAAFRAGCEFFRTAHRRRFFTP